jgi:hypothetical protein
MDEKTPPYDNLQKHQSQNDSLGSNNVCHYILTISGMDYFCHGHGNGAYGYLQHLGGRDSVKSYSFSDSFGSLH